MSTYATALPKDHTINTRDSTTSHPVQAEASDMQLVTMVLGGDQTAFECLFDRYKRQVAATAGRYFRQPEQVDEVIQIVFAKAYFEFARFRGVHDFSLASWLSRITVNACVDIHRSLKCKPENFTCELTDTERGELLDLTPSSEFTPEEKTVNRDLADKLLSKLGPEDRSLMKMLYSEEMTIRETADAMGWSVAKTKVRAWRAKNSLRSIIKKFL